jgi:hypothetical protein
MSRKPTIKWRESDSEKLINKIEKFNDKIYRTRNRHPELADILPDTIKKEDRLQKIEELKALPRSEFNKYINSLDRFTHKGAEKAITSATGNTVTRWEKNEVALKVAQINRERTKERKAVEQLEATTRGQKIGLKRGEMGSERLNELRPKKFDFNKIRGGKEWEKFKASVDKQASPEARDKRMEEYKQNYIQGLKNAFGDYANDIIDIINDLPADVVVQTYYGEQEATIEFFYEPQEMDFKLDVLEGIWQGVSDEYADEVHR